MDCGWKDNDDRQATKPDHDSNPHHCPGPLLVGWNVGGMMMTMMIGWEGDANNNPMRHLPWPTITAPPITATSNCSLGGNGGSSWEGVNEGTQDGSMRARQDNNAGGDRGTTSGRGGTGR